MYFYETKFIKLHLFRYYGHHCSLDEGNKYCNDSDGVSYPWYMHDSFVTIEGPTNKYSITHVLVSLFNKLAGLQ